MKYIDAEKLIKSVNNYREGAKAALNPIDGYADYYKGKIDACENIQEFITSLQQEQPEVDLVAELKHHLATTPKEQLEKEWKELEPWGNIGPTVQEFLYGKQPEVDLEKELDKWRNKHFKGKRDGDYSGEYLERESQLDIARHFYELGLNARKV